MRELKNGIFVVSMLLAIAGLNGCSDKAEMPAAEKPAQENTTGNTAPAPKPAPKPEPVADNKPVDGKAIYDTSCIACHAMAVAGAPKFGDAEAWAPRIAKGMDTLYANSINGFKGEAGIMPPKGGRLDLDDAAIKAAVDYMVEAAQ